MKFYKYVCDHCQKVVEREIGDAYVYDGGAGPVGWLTVATMIATDGPGEIDEIAAALPLPPSVMGMIDKMRAKSPPVMKTTHRQFCEECAPRVCLNLKDA